MLKYIVSLHKIVRFENLFHLQLAIEKASNK